ncbi:MAG: hypothetical protein AAFY46_14700, partial [Planctomycetota bacterium]
REEAEADPVHVAASVEDLDAELAGLADELLEGDFDDVDDVIEAGNPSEPVPLPTEAEPEAAHETEDDEPSLTGEVAESGTSTASDDASIGRDETDTDVDASVATDDSLAVVASLGDAATPDAQPEPLVQSAAAVEARPAVPALKRISAFAYETAVRASKPLDGKPTYVRDIVGWFAAVTLFNAVAVWAFWVLGREPDPAPTSTDVVSIEVPADTTTAEAAVTDLE